MREGPEVSEHERRGGFGWRPVPIGNRFGANRCEGVGIGSRRGGVSWSRLRPSPKENAHVR